MLPRAIFDTSGINALEAAGSASEPLMRGLVCGFEIILTAISADELISTKAPEKREALRRRFARLMGSGKCIWQPHIITELMISAHSTDPSRFDWTKVDVRARPYEAAIPRRDFPDELWVDQRSQQLKLERDFKKTWKALRPRLEEIVAKARSVRPTSYCDAVAIAVRDGGVLWSFGQSLYKKVSKRQPSEAEIKSFMDVCPPFRAACHGLVMAWYNGSLRKQDGTPTAGRNNLMMATYLPYCDQFITKDWLQKKNLREIATEARIGCEILSFDEFDLSFSVVA